MNPDALIEGEYIKAAELGSKLPAHPTWTIIRIEIENMPNLKKKDKTINKGVVYFEEIDRGWVMNRTNVECLKALFGADDDRKWLKHRVTLGTEPTKTGLGIRIVGSPDITEPVTATWAPPKQRAVSKTMVPTGERRQQDKPPTDEALTAFRTAVIAATKRAENPWTMEQITFALSAGGYAKAADVPVDRRAAFLELIAAAPPPAPEPTPTTEPESD